MFDHLVGCDGILWGLSPAMALVLLASAPSGNPQISRVRDKSFALMPMPNQPKSGYCGNVSVRHVVGDFHKFSSPLIYVGFGPSDIQSRPSQYANPYYFTCTDPEEALDLFREYIECRADLVQFLNPLQGAELVCDCKLGCFCHTSILVEYIGQVFGPTNEAKDSKFDAMSEACVMEGFEDDDDEDDGHSDPAPRFISNIEAMNETVRSGAATLDRERSAWLPSWRRLIVMIRSSPSPVFWEIFSGRAGLTREFLRQDWPCGPPIDILYNPEYDVLDPLFFCVMLGLIFERLIRVLHLGPPCSSFSMAVNRFKSYAMRSASCPAGFENLPPHREEKVRLGNALAEIACKLAEAQSKAGNFWTLEQPATSLMWLYACIAKLILSDDVFVVTVDVCMFGAPWRKPTSIAANFIGILRLRVKCNGMHSHISLQGNAPCGRSWTAVASPYWPAFAKAWVLACAHLFLNKANSLPPLYFAGFASVPADLTVEELLSDMSYVQPKGKETAVTAVRVSSGVQPCGRSLPQLLPDGLGPKDHVTVALATLHPMARPPTVPPWCNAAFAFQSKGVDATKKLRAKVLELLIILASLCAPISQEIAKICHVWIRPTVKKRNVAFMREVTFLCLGLDANLMIDFVFGLPMMGWARHSPIMTQRESSYPRANRPSAKEIAEENRIALERAKPSKNPKMDSLAWEKTKAEFVKETMKGPYYSLCDLPAYDPESYDVPRLLNRVGILEQHGGAAEESCRVIDDGKARGHNADSANTATHRPADLDLVAALARMVSSIFPSKPIAGFPSDFKSAYRQVPSDPAQAHDFVVVSWDAELQTQVFFLAVTQIFGSGNAPLNFCRFPDFCCRALAALMAISAVHCVDDVIVIEVMELITSAFECWRKFAELCGWDVPDEKSPPPSQCFRALGAILDFSGYPKGPMLIRPASDRLESLMILLGQVLAEQKLSPALAGKLYGKLMFMSSQYFGRLGRALLRAFSRRQHEMRYGINNQIRAACEFWMHHMHCMRPREIPLSLTDAPMFVSYSDGEGDSAGVGIALWCPGGRTIGGYIKLPDEVRSTWSRVAATGDHYDIFEIEAVGPALILHNWADLFVPGALWVHYIDNDSALATLVKGSSSVMSGECITAFTHSKIADLGLWSWFDRVASDDNPVDKLSRGSMDGPWELVPIEFPQALLVSLRAYTS